MNSKKTHYLSVYSLELPKFDTKYLHPKIKKLGQLLNSDSAATYLFSSITENIQSKTYIRTHVILAISLIQHHRKKCRGQQLNDFQQSLTEFVKELKSQRVKKTCMTIIKKIYLRLVSMNFFIADSLSQEFNIYTLCPASSSEVLAGHFKRIELYSKNIEITETTMQFINSKNIVKNYVSCYADVFEKITQIDPEWPSSSIKLGIEEYRNSFDTESGSLNTKYHATSKVLELFGYLIKIGLLDKNTVLPKNIKKPAYSSLMRSTNPTLSSININLLSIEQSLTSAKVLIDNFHSDLIKKLDYSTTIAKKVVTEFYNQLPENAPFPSDGIDPNIIVAMHIIIVDEMGINPTSLYNLQVNIATGRRNKKEFIKIEADGTVRVNIIKWRQRYLQKRTTTSTAVINHQKLQLQDVNASFCIQFAITLTQGIRKTLNTNLLWLRRGQGVVRKSNSFDSEFRKFCEVFLPEDFTQLEPTLMRIRSSRAISIYIESEGDIIKTASYLGNKVKTTLSTYIPLFLQEIIYRRKLYAFQNLYLILATADNPKKQNMLDMTEVQYSNCVKEIYKNEDFGGSLFELLKPKSVDTLDENSTEIFFICSPENFAHAIKVIKTSPNKENIKYKVCLNAINKASSGSIIFKSMIIDAENILDKEGISFE
ncbi:hypothetical protein ACRWQL_17930 [Shewanella sp. HL-SH4]|jgi:hypothetical protein|uniref:hypothetical protein n=1 Tax=Shewanella sp. HL-SH4 TaxID=3436240 RepID=UPI003EBB18FC